MVKFRGFENRVFSVYMYRLVSNVGIGHYFQISLPPLCGYIILHGKVNTRVARVTSGYPPSFFFLFYFSSLFFLTCVYLLRHWLSSIRFTFPNRITNACDIGTYTTYAQLLVVSPENLYRTEIAQI